MYRAFSKDPVTRVVTVQACYSSGYPAPVVPTVYPPGCEADVAFQQPDGNRFASLPASWAPIVTQAPDGSYHKFAQVPDEVHERMMSSDSTIGSWDLYTVMSDLYGTSDDGALNTLQYAELCWCGEGMTNLPLLLDLAPVQVLAFAWADETGRAVTVIVPGEAPAIGWETGTAPPAGSRKGGTRVQAVPDGLGGLTIKFWRPQEPRLIYRGSNVDADPKYLLQAGYPRYAVKPDDCQGDDGVRAHRLLHYPRWLYGQADPYGVSPTEPIGIIPIMVAHRCAPGLLYFVHAEIVVHGGHIVDLRWDTTNPGETAIIYADPTKPPPSPNWSGDATTQDALGYNLDYDGNPILSFTGVRTTPCNDEAAGYGTASAGVEDPQCPTAEDVGGTTIVTDTATGSTREAAEAAAILAVATTAGVPEEHVYLCYSYMETKTPGLWHAGAWYSGD